MSLVKGVTTFLGAKQQDKGAKHAAAKMSEGVEQGQAASAQHYTSALDALKAALAGGQDQLTSAESLYTPSYERGQQASQLQADLSGINGADAQAAAYQNFQSSPGQQWLQQRAENAILRNQGRLGGGLGNQASILQKLQENAQGMAQQDFGNQYNRISDIANRGDQSAGAISSIRSALASLISGHGANVAQLETGQGSEQAQLAQNRGAARAGRDIYTAQNAPAWAQGVNQVASGGIEGITSSLKGLGSLFGF